MPISFPTSKHNFNHPGGGTYRDDAGYELDVLVDQLELLGEALQDKVGAAASTPTANTVFVGTATGASQWLAGLTASYLAAGAVTQRAQSSAFSGTRTVASYADVDSTNGKVTLSTQGGDLLVFFVGYSANSSASIAQNVGLKLDSGADVGAIPVYSFPGAATYPIPFCIAWMFTGVSGTVASPVSHTVYARHINNSATGTMTTNGFLVVIEVRK